MLTEKKEARPAEGRASNAIQNDDTAPISLGATSIKIELLLSEVGASIGQIEAQLNCLAAMVAAGDSAGVVYSLRRLKAVWYALDLTATDLIAADAERLSAIRQQAEGEP